MDLCHRPAGLLNSKHGRSYTYMSSVRIRGFRLLRPSRSEALGVATWLRAGVMGEVVVEA